MSIIVSIFQRVYTHARRSGIVPPQFQTQIHLFIESYTFLHPFITINTEAQNRALRSFTSTYRPNHNHRRATLTLRTHVLPHSPTPNMRHLYIRTPKHILSITHTPDPTSCQHNYSNRQYHRARGRIMTMPPRFRYLLPLHHSASLNLNLNLNLIS